MQMAVYAGHYSGYYSGNYSKHFWINSLLKVLRIIIFEVFWGFWINDSNNEKRVHSHLQFVGLKWGHSMRAPGLRYFSRAGGQLVLQAASSAPTLVGRLLESVPLSCASSWRYQYCSLCLILMDEHGTQQVQQFTREPHVGDPCGNASLFPSFPCVRP